MSPVEEEVVVLKATIELIDAMMNHEVVQLLGNMPFAEAQFKSMTHHKYFSVILVDFLSETDKTTPIGRCSSYVESLKRISETPRFSDGAKIGDLTAAVGELTAWLDEDVEVLVWLPSLNRSPALTLTRATFLRMCGNISKHNFLRLGRVAKQLQTLLAHSGCPVDCAEALLALGDFYARFHDDILLYHVSRIAKMLNDVRWAIHAYLQPQYARSYVPGKDPSSPYNYTYPAGVTSPFARECFWELMNGVRSGPLFPRFKVHEVMRRRY